VSAAQEDGADRREEEDRPARPEVPDLRGDKAYPAGPEIRACLAKPADQEENILKTT